MVKFLFKALLLGVEGTALLLLRMLVVATGPESRLEHHSQNLCSYSP